MTIAELNALRAERTELLDLLGAIEAARGLLDADAIGYVGAGFAPDLDTLTAEGFAHETIGRSMRFRAERGLF